MVLLGYKCLYGKPIVLVYYSTPFYIFSTVHENTITEE